MATMVAQPRRPHQQSGRPALWRRSRQHAIAPTRRSSGSWRTPLIRRRARQYATLEVMNRVHPLWLTVRRHVDLRRVTSASCRVAS